MRRNQAVPSKRDIIGPKSPSTGLRWADFRWQRILAFVSGLASIILYLWINPFRHVADWVAAGVVPIPIGFILYGLTDQSWRTAMGIAVGISVGNVIATALNAAGIHLLP